MPLPRVKEFCDVRLIFVPPEKVKPVFMVKPKAPAKLRVSATVAPELESKIASSPVTGTAVPAVPPEAKLHFVASV